jgi:diguanylate cyclase (GGDEF)-like protein
MEYYNLGLLALEAIIYFIVLITLLHYRDHIGIGVFIAVLGTLHFLETYLAAKFYVAVPFGVVSPGSVMMFSGKLMMTLLLYTREDAATVRQLIYGLLIGNFICLFFGYLLSLHMGDQPGGGVLADDDFLREMGILMIWGSTLLYIDSIAVILIYERLGRLIGKSVVPRLFIASAVTLAFDQVGFYGVLHIYSGAPATVFWSGLIGKTGMAALYTLLAGAYLVLAKQQLKAPSRPLGDLYNDLTYREKYEQLLSRTGVDALTGLQDRGRLEQEGHDMLRAALRGGREFSLMVVDADHFKSVNDRFGHLEGDKVLKRIAKCLTNSVRPGDRVYRFGGEEFIVLVTRANHAEALEAAERIRSIVVEFVKAGDGEPVTISIGVATAPQHGQTLVELISAADRSLYIAKASGRNRVQGANIQAS